MAASPIPYRASEPSNLETQLGVLATDPSRAGAALQLLPAYQSLREDVGAAANAQADRNYLLQAMTAQHTATNQDDKTLFDIINSDRPGVQAIARGNPRYSRFFQGESPEATATANQVNQTGLAQQGATLQKTTLEGANLGQQSGATIPVQQLTAQLGYAPNMMQPEQIRIKQMEIAAANARAAADRNKVVYPTEEIGLDPNDPTKLTHKFTGVQPGQSGEIGRILLQNSLPSTAYNEQGQPVVVQPSQPSTPSGTVKSKSGAIIGQYGGSPASQAASKLPPPAKGEQMPAGGGSVQTTPTPTPSGGGTSGPMVQIVKPGGPGMPPIQKWQATVDDYVKRESAVRNMGTVPAIRLGRDVNTGQFWIVEGNKPMAPLN